MTNADDDLSYMDLQQRLDALRELVIQTQKMMTAQLDAREQEVL